MFNLIPIPTSIIPTSGEFQLSSATRITAGSSDPEVIFIANDLSAQLQRITGLQLAVMETGQAQDGIILQLRPDSDLEEEGYELSISANTGQLFANKPAGLFYAMQTLLQLIPPGSSGIVSLPAMTIRDTPRFSWRGAMLDVARHFFGVEDVKHFIDCIAHYKMNRLHLHLTDDQGWRIEIKSWPRLTEIGGRTQVGGSGGGYYTQEQYKDLVEYARSRYITIVPEIETPGHINAAMASYAELNRSEEATALYEGTEVGFSTLWADHEITYRFLEDVIRELAAMTPGLYIHIGGDEAKSTPKEDYRRLVKRIQEIVISHGKTPIGWADIGNAEVLPGTIAQHWDGVIYQAAKQQGAKIILSPANKVYLDMKYDNSTPLGLDWAGLISVKQSYDWEPGNILPMLSECDILGIEAALWTETTQTVGDIEYLVFPRLPGIAELTWSPEGHSWEEYRQRLAAHGRHMEALGINFYRTPEVDW